MSTLVVLPLKETVLFPGLLPLTTGFTAIVHIETDPQFEFLQFIQRREDALTTKFLACTEGTPGENSGLHKVGVQAKLVEIRRNSTKGFSILIRGGDRFVLSIQGMARLRVVSVNNSSLIKANVEPLVTEDTSSEAHTQGNTNPYTSSGSQCSQLDGRICQQEVGSTLFLDN